MLQRTNTKAIQLGVLLTETDQLFRRLEIIYAAIKFMDDLKVPEKDRGRSYIEMCTEAALIDAELRDRGVKK